MANDKKGYYKILGISISASNDEIRKAFKEKAHEMHPDKNKDRDTTKDFQLLNEAYNILINVNQDIVKLAHKRFKNNTNLINKLYN